MVSAIIKMELKEIIRDKGFLTSLSSVVIFIGLLLFSSIKNLAVIAKVFTPYLPLVIGLTVGYGLSGRLVREKAQGVIESLLCTPLRIWEIWLAKTLSISIISSLTTIIISLIISLLIEASITNLYILYLIVVVPIFITSALGLLCLIYFYLGMKQIQAVNYIVFFTLFIILFMILRTQPLVELTLKTMFIVIAFSIIIILISMYIVRYTNIESSYNIRLNSPSNFLILNIIS